MDVCLETFPSSWRETLRLLDDLLKHNRFNVWSPLVCTVFALAGGIFLHKHAGGKESPSAATGWDLTMSLRWNLF